MPHAWLDQVFNSDVMRGIQAIPDESIDLIVADPPYGLGKDYGNDSDKMGAVDFLRWTQAWLELVLPKLKPNGSLYIFTTWRYSPEIFVFLKSRMLMLNEIIWDRKVPSMGGSTRRYSSVHDTIGFFANSNHYAISLAASLPLVWAGLTLLFNRRSKVAVNPLLFVLFSGMAVFFILGFMLSGSRAGLALGMFGCLLMLPSVILADEHKGAKHWLFGTMAVGLFFTVQAGLYLISLQFETTPLEDLRLQFFPITVQAASQFAPWGSGPGSFWYVFPQFDGFLTGNVIVNHAHNDYLELWLEMRWFFLIAALIALAVFLWQGVHIWFRSEGFRAESTLLAQAAWIGLLLLLLHSSVDYPLRTTALSMMAGLLAAFLVREKPKQLPVAQD